MTEVANVAKSQLGEVPQLGQFNSYAKLDIIDQRIEVRFHPFAQHAQLRHHRCEPARADPSDQEIGLHVFKQVEQARAPLDRLAPAFGKITDRLQGQDGIEPGSRRNGRRGIGPRRALLTRRNESRTAAGLADGVPASDTAAAIGGIYAQGS